MVGAWVLQAYAAAEFGDGVQVPHNRSSIVRFPQFLPAEADSDVMRIAAPLPPYSLAAEVF